MGKSNKGTAGSGGGSNDDSKHDQKLQAILLTDSFIRTFYPVTLDPKTPKALCPLNNVTMIDRALEYLAGAGVGELYVHCSGRGGDAVENHLSQGRWKDESSSTTTMEVTCIRDAGCTNAGDALRELDKRGLIRSDPFVLMSVDVVTNADLAPVLAAHTERKKKDSSAVLTVLLKRVGSWGYDTQTNRSQGSPLRHAGDDLIVAMNPTTHRILLYDSRPERGEVALPASFFTSQSAIQLHSDLIDSHLYVASPGFLARISDEFDSLDLQQHFIPNTVAEEEEGLQSRVFGHVLPDAEYAARVHDFRTYHAISHDLLRRWCYPIVPDNLPSGYQRRYRYALGRRFLYREVRTGGTKIARDTTDLVIGPGMIGAGVHIDTGCRIEGTVIGNHCQIHSKSTLLGSHLWKNVVVQKGATVHQSILCDDVIIKMGATVSRGCIIGQGCIIGEGVVLPEFTRVTLSVDDDDDDDDDFGDFDDDDDDDDESDELEETTETKSPVTSDVDIVGSDGMGRVWIPRDEDEDQDNEYDDDDDDDDNGITTPIEVMKSQSIGYDTSDLFRKRLILQEEEPDGFSDGEEDDDDNNNNNDDGAVGWDDGEGFSSPIIGRQHGVDVVKELKSICLDHDESSPIENLAIELNSFKFSQNATYSDCCTAAVLAILERMNISSGMSAGALVGALKRQLSHWGPLFRNKIRQGMEEEMSIIKTLETAATMSDGDIATVLSTEPSFRFLLQTFYDEDILKDEGIMAWAEKMRNDDSNSAAVQLFQQKPTQDFLEWLEESDDDDDDDDDDNDDDDNDDDDNDDDDDDD